METSRGAGGAGIVSLRVCARLRVGCYWPPIRLFQFLSQRHSLARAPWTLLIGLGRLRPLCVSWAQSRLGWAALPRLSSLALNFTRAHRSAPPVLSSTRRGSGLSLAGDLLLTVGGRRAGDALYGRVGYRDYGRHDKSGNSSRVWKVRGCFFQKTTLKFTIYQQHL
jgi:hypothetical protein